MKPGMSRVSVFRALPGAAGPCKIGMDVALSEGSAFGPAHMIDPGTGVALAGSWTCGITSYRPFPMACLRCRRCPGPGRRLSRSAHPHGGAVSPGRADRHKEMCYNAFNNLVPITQLADVPLVLVVPPDSSIKTVHDLVASARREPTSSPNPVTPVSTSALGMASGCPRAPPRRSWPSWLNTPLWRSSSRRLRSRTPGSVPFLSVPRLKHSPSTCRQKARNGKPSSRRPTCPSSHRSQGPCPGGRQTARAE